MSLKLQFLREKWQLDKRLIGEKTVQNRFRQIKTNNNEDLSKLCNFMLQG